MQFGFNRSCTSFTIPRKVYNMLQQLIGKLFFISCETVVQFLTSNFFVVDFFATPLCTALSGLSPTENDEFLFLNVNTFWNAPGNPRRLCQSSTVLQAFRHVVNQPPEWAALKLWENKLNAGFKYSSAAWWRKGQGSRWTGQCNIHLRQWRVTGINGLLAMWLYERSSMDRTFRSIEDPAEFLKQLAFFSDTSVEKLVSECGNITCITSS